MLPKLSPCMGGIASLQADMVPAVFISYCFCHAAVERLEEGYHRECGYEINYCMGKTTDSRNAFHHEVYSSAVPRGTNPFDSSKRGIPPAHGGKR